MESGIYGVIRSCICGMISALVLCERLARQRAVRDRQCSLWSVMPYVAVETRVMFVSFHSSHENNV